MRADRASRAPGSARDAWCGARVKVGLPAWKSASFAGVAGTGSSETRLIILRGNSASVTRYALSHGFNVIVEGILRTDHYAEMLMALIDYHEGRTCCYYLDVPFDESLRRHAGKPQASKYGAIEMKAWYRELDLLPGGTEQVIPAAVPQDEIVRGVMADSGLAAGPTQEGL